MITFSRHCQLVTKTRSESHQSLSGERTIKRRITVVNRIHLTVRQLWPTLNTWVRFHGMLANPKSHGSHDTVIRYLNKLGVSKRCFRDLEIVVEQNLFYCLEMSQQ